MTPRERSPEEAGEHEGAAVATPAAARRRGSVGGVGAPAPDDVPEHLERPVSPEVHEEGQVPPEAERVPPFEAVRRRPVLFVLPVLALVLPALVFALLRPASHTAEATLIVGRLAAETQAVPGSVEASRQLADSYSRLVGTRLVLEPVAERLGMTVTRLQDRVWASAVPESAIITVTGEGRTAREAVVIADNVAIGLVSYAAGGVEDEVDPRAEAEAVLDEYVEATSLLNQAQADRTELEATLQEMRANDATPAAELDQTADALAAAIAEEAAAQLWADVSANRYREVQRSAVSTGRVEVLAPASEVGSNRVQQILLALVGPGLAGALLGAVLATGVVNRPPRPAGGQPRPSRKARGGTHLKRHRASGRNGATQTGTGPPRHDLGEPLDEEITVARSAADHPARQR
jgi:hypothetical protein